jgi:hypothetical protein
VREWSFHVESRSRMIHQTHNLNNFLIEIQDLAKQLMQMMFKNDVHYFDTNACTHDTRVLDTYA